MTNCTTERASYSYSSETDSSSSPQESLGQVLVQRDGWRPSLRGLSHPTPNSGISSSLLFHTTVAMQVLLPGDHLPTPSTSSAASADSKTLHLGPGLSLPIAASANGKGKGREEVTANRAGLLGYQEDAKNEKWWIETQSRRYRPHPPEPVIGIIVARHAEGYRVDIGSSQAASLDALAFEGATKRSKPNLKVGTIVYAHLLATPPFSEPEISCVDAATQKAAGFGELTGGFLVRGVELGRCRALLSPKNPVLSKLGAQFPFEVAVGMNGRIWVNAADGEEEKLIQLAMELKGRP